MLYAGAFLMSLLVCTGCNGKNAYKYENLAMLEARIRLIESSNESPEIKQQALKSAFCKQGIDKDGLYAFKQSLIKNPEEIIKFEEMVLEKIRAMGNSKTWEPQTAKSGSNL